MPVVGTVVQTEYPKDDDAFRIFPVPHNWSEAFRYSLEFLTDILPSVNGKEQRRAVRSRPRFTCEIVGNVVGHARLNLEYLMSSRQHQQVMVGLEQLALTMTAKMPPEAMGASFNPAEPGQAPFWLEAGLDVVLVHGTDLAVRESRTIASVGVSGMTFNESTTTEFPVGSRILPGYLAFLEMEQSASRLTSTAGTASFPIKFRPQEGGRQVPDIGDPYYVGNLEVFRFKPNWGGGNEYGFVWPHNVIDFPFGQWRNWTPVEFPSRNYKFAYSTKTLRAVYEIMAFYQRHRGMRSEFFLPTWGDDIPATTLAGGGLSILVAGEAFGKTYENSTVFRRVMVRYTDGTVSYHQVEYIQPLPGTGSSVVRVIEPLPITELTPQTVLGISWLLVSRFAADRLDVDFLTNGVAELSIPMKTLENYEL